MIDVLLQDRECLDTHCGKDLFEIFYSEDWKIKCAETVREKGENKRPRQRIDCQSKIYSTAIVRWIEDTVNFAETERSERKP